MDKNLKRKASFKSPLASNSKRLSLEQNDKKFCGGVESDVMKEFKELSQEVSMKKDILRKLNLVKMYRTKEEFSNLSLLTNKWRACSQEVIQDLHELLPEPRPSMLEFMVHLQIDPSVLRYNKEDDTFIS